MGTSLRSQTSWTEEAGICCPVGAAGRAWETYPEAQRLRTRGRSCGKVCARLSLRAGLDGDQTATAPFLNPSSCLHPVTAQAPPERVTGSCALTQPPYPLYSNLSSAFIPLPSSIYFFRVRLVSRHREFRVPHRYSI